MLWSMGTGLPSSRYMSSTDFYKIWCLWWQDKAYKKVQLLCMCLGRLFLGVARKGILFAGICTYVYLYITFFLCFDVFPKFGWHLFDVLWLSLIKGCENVKVITHRQGFPRSIMSTITAYIHATPGYCPNRKKTNQPLISAAMVIVSMVISKDNGLWCVQMYSKLSTVHCVVRCYM